MVRFKKLTVWTTPSKIKGENMKKNSINAILAFALASFVSANLAFANDEHHPEEKKEAPKAEAQNTTDQGMMGKMDMGQMHAMMGECMKMHKDGKMCEHNTMEKCQSQMDKGDCQKMMKETKKDAKKKK